MNQIRERVEELKEIHVNKMNFRVISKHPEYAKNVQSQISRSMRKDLYMECIRLMLYMQGSH